MPLFYEKTVVNWIMENLENIFRSEKLPNQPINGRFEIQFSLLIIMIYCGIEAY